MNKKTLTKALAINVVVLVLVVALLGGLTFAWFSTRQTADTTQVIQVGNFAINLNDTPEEYVADAPSIKFMNAFPSTDTVANADDTVVETAGKKENVDYLKGNKFAFSIENAGDIDALLHLDIAVNGVNSEKLKDALRFNVYTRDDSTGTVIYNKIKYKKSNTDIISFGGLKAELLKNINGGTNVMLPETEGGEAIYNSEMIAFNAKDKVEFAIVTWIDNNTEYGTDANQVKGGDTFEFAVQIAAIQSVGGITKVDIEALKAGMPPQVWNEYYKYADTVDTSKDFGTKEFTYKYTMDKPIGNATYLANAQAGKYGNVIELTLNNKAEQVGKATWTVDAITGNTATEANIVAYINDVEYTGLTAIAAALSDIELSAGINNPIKIAVYVKGDAANPAEVIALKFSVKYTVTI